MKNKRFKIKKRWILLLVLVLAIGGFYALKIKAPAQAAAMPSFSTILLEKKTVSEKVLISGLAVSEREQMMQAGFTGKINEIAVAEGDLVKEDQVMIRMEDSKALAIVKQAELNLQEAQEKLTTFNQDAGQSIQMNYQAAKMAYDRAMQTNEEQQQLLLLGSISAQAADQAKEALTQAKSSYLEVRIQYEAFDLDQERAKRILGVEQAESELADAKEEWNNAEVKSPMDGVVTNIDVKAGDQVQVGTNLVEVKDVGSLKVLSTINEFDAANLTQGNPVTIRRNADPDKDYHGTIIYLSPAGVRLNGKTVFEVEVQVDDEDDLFKINNSVQMEIIVNEKDDVLAVPFEAVGDQDGQKVLYVERDGVETIIPVELGVRGDYNVEVSGQGLQEGDTVRVYVEDAGAFIERW
jgi:HlyD family secretion protein